MVDIMAVARHSLGLLVALTLQPDASEPVPTSTLSEGDVLMVGGFFLMLAAVFGFDMLRTWWQTNQWRRDARRRRREMR